MSCEVGYDEGASLLEDVTMSLNIKLLTWSIETYNTTHIIYGGIYEWHTQNKRF